MRHVVQFVHSFKIGGSEVLAESLAKGLSKKKWKCSFWTMSSEGHLRQRLVESHIGAASFDCSAGASFSTMLKIIPSLRQHKVSALITHHFRQLFHAVPAALLTGTPLIHVEHDYHFYSDGLRYLPILRRLLLFVSSFVVVSEELVAEFRQGLGSDVPCIAIPNGVDTECFQKRNEIRLSMRSQHGYDQDCLVIGTCCRLEPVKQLNLLLTAFAQYFRSNGKARLVIVGDGSLSGELKHFAQNAGISDQVVFAGAQGNVDEYLCMFDIFALTSVNEGLPLAVLEAMSAELPVVSTDVGSLAAVVNDDTGILVQEQSPEAIAGAFGSLENPVTRKTLGQSARNRVLQHHSQESMVNAYNKILSASMKSPLRCLLRLSA
ncbi:glycosyltransferase [Pelotalea chapellei]|uniref:Glycosyltransferase n=1 Tax=Pelotalea chapellei TaxID=44671 RepID=A0ABS5U5E6_9BACT|nr:glycosyltransferase [Pelotalea chapellei]MBT1070891.1 glycosyltransferase [Pelotalea chapellei]